MQPHQCSGLGQLSPRVCVLPSSVRLSTGRSLLCRPHHQQRQARQATLAFEQQIKPAYNKYRSRNDVEKSYLQQWKETTARDGKNKPQTVWSTLWYVPVWMKYHVVPYIVRYAWYIVWSAVKAEHYRFHKWAILEGAKLDVYLAQKGGFPIETFSRSLAMKRFHYKVSLGQNLKYRYRLYKGQAEQDHMLSEELQTA